MKVKKIVKYLLCLLPWFISSLIFKIDTGYYNSLNLPFFAPPPIVFPIVWTLLYILISICIYKTIDEAESNYKVTLVINYLSNQLFTLFFFVLKNNLLAFIDCLIVLISSISLYIIVNKFDSKSSKYLIPYIIWNLFASVLSLTIFVLN